MQTGCSAVNANGATTFTGCKIDKPGTGYVLVGADGAFMVESSPFDVTAGLDTTAPTISAAAIADPNATSTGLVHQGGSYYVYAEATDAESGVATVTANVSNVTTGATAVSLTTTGGPWTFGAQTYHYRSAPQTANGSLSVGAKTFTVNARDNAGNATALSNNGSVTVDNTAPVVTLTKVNGSTVTFPFTTGTNVTSVGGACTNAASDFTTVSVTVGTENGTATCTAGAWTYTLTTPLSTDGAYTASATQSDQAGNVGSSGSKSITLDKTAPSISAAVIANTITSTPGLLKKSGDYTIYANVSDAGSGVSTVTANATSITVGASAVNLGVCASSCTVGGSTYGYKSATQTAQSSLTEGTRAFTVTATDVVGNSSGAVQGTNVTIDNTAPTVSSITTTNGNGTFEKSDTLVITFSEAMSGVSVGSGVVNITETTGGSITIDRDYEWTEPAREQQLRQWLGQ